jgi:hypothetical protein
MSFGGYTAEEREAMAFERSRLQQGEILQALREHASTTEVELPDGGRECRRILESEAEARRSRRTAEERNNLAKEVADALFELTDSWSFPDDEDAEGDSNGAQIGTKVAYLLWAIITGNTYDASEEGMRSNTLSALARAFGWPILNRPVHPVWDYITWERHDTSWDSYDELLAANPGPSPFRPPAQAGQEMEIVP